MHRQNQSFSPAVISSSLKTPAVVQRSPGLTDSTVLLTHRKRRGGRKINFIPFSSASSRLRRGRGRLCVVLRAYTGRRLSKGTVTLHFYT